MTIQQAYQAALLHHQSGRLAEAEGIYRGILAIDPGFFDALHMLGLLAHQAGHPAAAAEILGQAVKLSPNDSGCHSNFSEVLRVAGRLDEAIAAGRIAMELDPRSVAAHFNLANALQERGLLDHAISEYQTTVQLKPDYAGAWSNLGLALNEQGRFNEAIDAYQTAIRLNPNFYKAHFNAGAAFRGLGNLEAAVACYQRALALNPSQPETHNNLGDVFKAQEKVDEAVACFRQALVLNPDFVLAHNNLGSGLREQGRTEEAIACFRRALALDPNLAEARSNLGVALMDQEKLDEAVSLFRQTLALKPDLDEAHHNLGVAFIFLGKLDDAIACCGRALEINPSFVKAYNSLGAAFKDQGRLDDAIACYRRAVELKPDFSGAESNIVYTQTFQPGWDARAILEAHRRWNELHAAPLAKLIEPHLNDHRANRRLRVGYVSPDFRDHVIGRNLLPLMREHDHERFEIHCYSDAHCPDEITKRFQGYAAVWRETAHLTDARLAQLVREDRIDILVDLTLHLAKNRLLVFARQPAPVQATFAGYPGTTGLATIAYRLTDPHLDPPGLFDDCYAEESIRLPDSFWCYDPIDAEPSVNQLPAVFNGFVTFGCFNNFCKLNASVLELWARVLKAVDCSRLTILAGEGSHCDRALELLEAEGIDRARLTFASPRHRAGYLKHYHGIDIGLDTVPYNGHTTSLDSLWMGVPVVTLVGPTVVGRAGLSQLTNLGLPELIAATPEQYVRIAAELAHDLSRLGRLRATLRDRMQASPLMDAPRFARNIEAAYRMMWQRWSTKEVSRAPIL